MFISSNAASRAMKELTGTSGPSHLRGSSDVATAPNARAPMESAGLPAPSSYMNAGPTNPFSHLRGCWDPRGGYAAQPSSGGPTQTGPFQKSLGLDKIDLEGAGLRLGAVAAEDKYDKTKDAALEDRRITKKERRQIDSAGRDANIADKKVELHDAKKSLEEVTGRAMQDMKLTPDEARQIRGAADEVSRLEKRLKKMTSEDKTLDCKDRRLDRM